jgi:hypothetical protein
MLFTSSLISVHSFSVDNQTLVHIFLTGSGIFIKKIGSGMHSDQKLVGSKLFIPVPGKEGSGTLFPFASF